jgi:hypothetical protein
VVPDDILWTSTAAEAVEERRSGNDRRQLPAERAARFEAALEAHKNAEVVMQAVAIDALRELTRERYPTATLIFFGDSDQDPDRLVLIGFGDAKGDEVGMDDEPWDDWWQYASSLTPYTVGLDVSHPIGYSLEVNP